MHPLLVFIVVVVSGLMLIYGGLSFMAELRARPGEPALAQLQRGLTPDETALQELAAAKKSELEILKDPTSLGDLALTQLLLTKPRGPGRAEDLAEAEALLVEALSRAPANPYLWARLALIRELRNAPAAAVIQAIDLSVLTGPNIAKLALLRAELAFRHLRELSPTQLDALDQQTWLAWRHEPDALVEMAEINGQLPFVEKVIAAHGGDLDRFLRLQFLTAPPSRP